MHFKDLEGQEFPVFFCNCRAFTAIASTEGVSFDKFIQKKLELCIQLATTSNNDTYREFYQRMYNVLVTTTGDPCLHHDITTVLDCVHTAFVKEKTTSTSNNPDPENLVAPWPYDSDELISEAEGGTIRDVERPDNLGRRDFSVSTSKDSEEFSIPVMRTARGRIECTAHSNHPSTLISHRCLCVKNLFIHLERQTEQTSMHSQRPPPDAQSDAQRRS
jgi:hypothetical protein